MYGTPAEKQPLSGSAHIGGASNAHLSSMQGTIWLLLVVQVTCLVILNCAGHIGAMSDKLQQGVGNQNLSDFTALYNMFMGVQCMMFFGFGYLMTFLKRYGLGAVGFTMLVTCISLEWGVICEAFFTQMEDGVYGPVEIHLPALINGSFAAAALLISFGGVIGRVSPLQLVVMSLIEIVVYTFNKRMILEHTVGLADDGGTIIIHTFGAYFGLAVSYVLGVPNLGPENQNSNMSDMLSLVGTVFLWIYWPSFVSGPLMPEAATQQRAAVNTVLALVGSTVTVFFLSPLLDKNTKFRPVDVQNATLAGGVSIGCTASLSLGGGDALFIGVCAGAISTIGFARVQSIVQNLGIYDSCGIHNLHGMPSVFGAIVSVFMAYHKGPLGHDAPDVYWAADPSAQGGRQLQGLLYTLATAIVSGLVTGYILVAIRPSGVEDFNDAEWWELGENPFPQDELQHLVDRVDAIEGKGKRV